MTVKQPNSGLYQVYKKVVKSIKKNGPFLLMALPGFILLFLFAYMPIFGLLMAFKEIDYSKSIFEMTWIGFENFEYFFKNPSFWPLIKNTLGFNIAFLIIGATVPVFYAIGLSLLNNKRAGKLYQAIILVPHFISWIVISLILRTLLEYDLGFLNNALAYFGFERVRWYYESDLWPFIIVFLSSWKGLGYTGIIYHSAIMGIDEELYEAASMDGASVFRQIFSITLPSLKPTIVMLLILGLGNIIGSDFDLFYNVPQGSLAMDSTTNVFSVFIYNTMKIHGDLGMSMAGSFFQSIVGFVLVVLTNSIVRRIDETQALY